MVGGFQDIKVSDDFNMQLHSLMSEGFFDEGYPLFGHAVCKVAERCLGEEKRQVALHAPGGFLSEEYKEKCKDVKKQDHNYQFAGYKELRRVLAIGRIISILRDYYSGKKARISVEGGLSEEFELETGLGQGCCVAPLLFNIFLAAVVEAWVGESGGGVHWLTRIDGALLHREAQDKYSSWEALDLHELGYADDAALIADTLSQLHGMAKGFQLHLREWGLQLSVEKTEAMSSAPGSHAPIQVEEFEGFDAIKFSEYFEYLG
ncbi:unnamed protein product, partial [Symbiodinium necroappetens]